MNAERTLRVCYFGTYRQEYSRNRIMIKGLQRNGVEVIECHEPLWHGIDDRVQSVGGGWMKPDFWWRVASTYGRLIQKYLSVRSQYDILIVGYPGQFDVFLARILSWWAGKPLVWDVFMSIYLIATERGLHQRNPRMVGIIGWIERMACRLPDRLILDTAAYVEWFCRTHDLQPTRFALVPTGVDSDAFQPVQVALAPAADRKFRVLYYGTFIPNHGVHTIVEAAVILKENSSIEFVLIGEGPDLDGVKAIAAQHDLCNVSFVGWLEQQALVQQISAADVCLGAFGTTPQSLMTVQNKIYEGMAMGRPVLTGDGVAIRASLLHGTELYLCTRADPAALAQAILQLQADPPLRVTLARNGFARIQNNFTINKIGLSFRTHLDSIVA